MMCNWVLTWVLQLKQPQYCNVSETRRTLRTSQIAASENRALLASYSKPCCFSQTGPSAQMALSCSSSFYFPDFWFLKGNQQMYSTLVQQHALHQPQAIRACKHTCIHKHHHPTTYAAATSPRPLDTLLCPEQRYNNPGMAQEKIHGKPTPTC